MPNRVVRPIHFDDFSGADFERLVFAYHLRAGWTDVAWYGQTGSDQGRDIIGTEPRDDGPNRRTVIQCVNRARLTQAKAEADMAAVVAAPTGAPDAFKFVCRCGVSAERRDQIASAARKLGVGNVTVWSGTEFEEELRLRAEFLLLRLVDGVPFPDAETELRSFVDELPDLDDDAALKLIAPIFDRPAFRTRFQEESSLPAFLQAIEDTIGALNTGVWRTRDGVEIRRIPSLHHIRNAARRSQLSVISRGLDNLRRRFKQGLADGTVRHCACGQDDCPVFIIDRTAAKALDDARRCILDEVQNVIPGFLVPLS